MNWINVPRYQFIFLFLGCQLGKLVDFLHHVRELVEEVEWIEQRKQQQQQTNNFCLANCKLLSSCNFVSPVWCTQMTLVGYDAVAAFVSFHFYSPGWKVLLGDTFGKSLVAIGTIIESSTEEETHACHDFFRRDGWFHKLWSFLFFKRNVPPVPTAGPQKWMWKFPMVSWCTQCGVKALQEAMWIATKQKRWGGTMWI